MAGKTGNTFKEELTRARYELNAVEKEFSKKIIGNVENLRFILKALLSNGHVLLEGVPGIGKTLIVKTIAQLLDLHYGRIQFTPDLMPADIVGTNIIVEDEQGGRHFRFEKGPIFTNILLADEINRASPKTQSALLQSMEEQEVTIFGKTHAIDNIFITLATQNPIEMSGTYPLPEAQLDRFFFKLNILYPELEALKQIAKVNAETSDQGDPVSNILTRDRILEIRKALQQIPVTDRIYDFATRLVHLTNPNSTSAPADVRTFVRYGASPRGLIALIAASRVSAVMDGRFNVSIDDLETNYLPSLRHRIVLKFEGEIEGVDSDALLSSIFKEIRASF